MSEATVRSCEEFEEAAGELALGTVGGPLRSALLAHASSCTACGALLADLSALSDGLLHLAPEVEPPVGFETRAVARMGQAWPAAPVVRRWRTRAGVVVAMVVAAVGGVMIGRTTTDDAREVASGMIVARSGERTGTAELDSSGEPRIVLTMDRAGSWPGAWTCQLLAGDGTWVDVGSWTADEVDGRVWAAGIDQSLADASRMRILGQSGTVVATARLDR